MSYHFRGAVKSSAKILIGIYAESGRGKSLSALLLARGFVGPAGKIAMIETESGRGEIYVDVVPGGYQVCPLSGNYAPKEYGKAITEAEKAKFDALIIDSASHEWEGIGGVLSMAAENQVAGKKGPLVWQVPKIDHSREFVLRLMQSPIPIVIVNMRAKYPMEQVAEKHVQQHKQSGRGGKPPVIGEWFRSPNLEPKQSDDILFEMLIHGWIDDEHKFHVTKYPKAIPELRGVIVDGEPLSIAAGERLAQWAASAARKEPKPEADPADSRDTGASVSGPTGGGDSPGPYITADQALQLDARCSENSIDPARLRKAAKVERLSLILASDLDKANAWITKAIADSNQAQTT